MNNFPRRLPQRKRMPCFRPTSYVNFSEKSGSSRFSAYTASLGLTGLGLFGFFSLSHEDSWLNRRWNMYCVKHQLQACDLFIFDYDGTLCDTKRAVLESLKHTYLELGFNPPSHHRIINKIALGLGLEEIFTELSGKDFFLEQDIKQWVAIYRSIYKRNSLQFVSLFDGVEKLFYALKANNKRIVIVSNKGEEAIKQSLDHFGLTGWVDKVAGATEGCQKKPHPMLFEKRIEPDYPNIPRNKIVMIGDTRADIEFAHAIKACSVWVSYGFGNKKDASKADICMHSLNDLIEIIALKETCQKP